ncbi:MAG: NADH-quinone oxidoreductase subunit N [Acidimicrobiia bacterium]|nr:MAG: NADH-quinone oxidoreductase subunit N [Acidimicrobiia bacterium]
MTAQMGRAAVDVLPVLIFAGGAIMLIFYVMFVPRALQVWSALGATVVLAVAGFASGWYLGRAPTITFFGTFAADRTWLWGTLIIVIVTVLTVALSVEWFRSDSRQGEYYVLLLFSALGAVLLAGAVDLMELILAMLLSSVTGYTLTAYHRKSRAATEAGIKYYLLGALANGAMVYGAALLFGLSGGTSFADLRSGLVNADPTALIVGFGMVAIGIAFKLGAIPAHQWMPDVAQGAPAPAAAFLLVAGKVGALIVLMRFAAVLPDAAVGWRPLVAVIAALTMTLGNLAALWQDDVRRMLGWSSVSQTGYGLLAVVALGRSDLAIPSMLFFLAAYAMGNMAAFAVIVKLRGLTDRESYRGLASVHPWLMGALVVSFLSFIGVPPLGGFTAKLLLMGAVIEAGYTWLAALAVVNSVISLFYYARVMGPAYFGPAARPRPLMGSLAAWAVGVATVAVVAIGVIGQPLAAAWQELVLLIG